ncbi:MAG: ATP-binding protein [Pyrinomonadaceae bacterium]
MNRREGHIRRAIPFPRSVRAKLLVILVALSLPLLIVSLNQINNYRRSLDDQTAIIARIETAAAASALTSWLEDHPAVVAKPDTLAPDDASKLSALLQRSATANASTDIAVFDAQGKIVPVSSAPVPTFLKQAENLSDATRLMWSDGVERVTSTARVEPYGWNVAIGLPVLENSVAGHALLTLAATWAATLLASALLLVWAVTRFTKPLRKLAASASTLGDGQLQERVAVETDDEVGALAEGFNVMAAHLESKFDELQTQGAFIEEVLDGLPLGVAVLDASLIVRKANPTFAKFVGGDPAALKGRGLYEAAAGLAVLSDVVEDVRRTRKPFVTYSLPLTLVAPAKASGAKIEQTNFWDVTLWPVTERGAERGDLVVIMSEVSKRVRAEKLATSAFASERARAAELASVINQMSEGVIIIDRQERYRINIAAAGIIGRKPSEFRDGVQALIADLALRNMDGHEIPEMETPLARALRERQQVEDEPLKIVRDDGETRVVALSATPLVGEDGEPEGAVAVFRDITEKVEQHAELVAAYERLREHDRLKSAFVSNISHELRTPLNVIMGLCQLLERDTQLPLAPLQDEAVRRMERNARALLELVNDLLDYSRLESGQAALRLETVDVANAIQGIAANYLSEAENKGIALQINASQEIGDIVTDRHKLSQVLSNLIGNAIKFTSAGTVAVNAAALDAERWYVEVSDTGIGMSSEALSYIFDEFRQVDDRLARAYGGTGLGLAITRKIVELLEGEITVESKPDEGSRFRLTWPRAIRQHTGTGSLADRAVPDPAIQSAALRARAR